MRARLIESITQRLDVEIAPQNPIKFLKKFTPEEYIDDVISTVYLYTRAKKGSSHNTIYLVEVASAVGHAVRTRLRQKRNSSIAVKTGAFLLYSFELFQILQVVLGQGKNHHASYIIQMLDDDCLHDLWNNIDTDTNEKLPSLTPYAPWVTSKHETGISIVKTKNKDVLSILHPETHPLIFNSLNKSQAVGWQINEEIFNIHLWALRNKTKAFSEIWDAQNPEAKTTKLREAKAIGSIAQRFLGKVFYHLYYYDFRGRKYTTTAYLHEQGSDLARGLLLRKDCKSIGIEGFFCLMVSIASNWAGDAGREDGAKTDKIPLKERYLWAMDNEEILLSYAESPKVHQGWMDADKPWQFLAACFELKKLREWQYISGDPENPFEDYSYKSHLEAYIDGSNNGSQHLTALTRDEVTAPHVNLIPQTLPGDLYKYIADHVWERLNEAYLQIPIEDINKCNEFIDALMELKIKIHNEPSGSELRQALVDDIKLLKEQGKQLGDKPSIVYWMRITDAKHKRKIVKRNVMTLPYGGTAYGLGQQQIDDAKKHGIDQLLYMEHKWGAFLGREVFEDCRISLKRPMQLLSIFEQAGKQAEADGKFLSWIVPVTDFPVVQNYVEGKIKKVYVQYGPPRGERNSSGYYDNTLQLNVCFIEEPIPSKRKQSQGASPNAIHSLDAAHLTMIVNACDFPVTTIHDSFGCLLADMPTLFRIVRETFVELYKHDPLTQIMKYIGGDTSNVVLGNLDLSLVLDSEYCFC
jgi:DNA-directed RNA polymerase